MVSSTRDGSDGACARRRSKVSVSSSRTGDGGPAEQHAMRGRVGVGLVDAGAVDAVPRASRGQRGQALGGFARHVRIVRVGAWLHRIAGRVERRKTGHEQHRFALVEIAGRSATSIRRVIVHAVDDFAPLGSVRVRSTRRGVERQVVPRVEPLERRSLRQQVKRRIEMRPGVIGQSEALAVGGDAACASTCATRCRRCACRTCGRSIRGACGTWT